MIAPESICPGCGVRLPAIEGPSHRYLEPSPACWAAYGEVLAREYASPALRASNRTTVDAYAAQHPGRPGPQSIQSVAGHLIALYAALELGMPAEEVNRLLERAVTSRGFFWLDPPASRGALTVASVLPVGDAASHALRVRAWATSVWEAWSAHHAQVRAWAGGFLAGMGPGGSRAR